MAPDDAVIQLVERVLAEFEPRLATLGAGIVERVLQRVPPLDGDAELIDAIDRTFQANAAMVIALLKDPELPIEPAPEAVAISGPLARSEQSVGSLIEGYHVGQTLFLEAWLGALAAAAEDVSVLALATTWSFRRICEYLDATLARTTILYGTEHTRWRASRFGQQWSIVRQVLAAPPAEADAVSRRLGYDLSTSHVAMVLERWPPSHSAVDLAPTEPLETARSIARQLGVGSLLAVLPSPGMVYAWYANVPPASEAIAERLEPCTGVRLAIGPPRAGVGGFVASHRHALWTRDLARRLPEHPAVVDHKDVSALTLIRDDEAQLGAFVVDQLGGLAVHDQAVGELRTTAAVALEEGLNASRAAKRLMLHKNTVLYRLKSAEELRGRPLAEGRFECELALRLVAAFGARLLQPDSEPR